MKKRKGKKEEKSSMKLATAKGVASMNEMEISHHSKYVEMQLQEVLKTCKITQKYEQMIEKSLKTLHERVMQLPETRNQHINDISWLKTDVKFPAADSINSDISVCWAPPTDVKLLGSYQLKTALKKGMNVDVVLEMPPKCLNKKAYLNHQYFTKRSYYLSYIAHHLRKLDYVINFSYFMEDHLKPIVLLSLPDSLDFVTIRIHACPSPELFNQDKLMPNINNFTKICDETVLSDSKYLSFASAHYNSSILIDIQMSLHLNFIHQMIKDSPALQDGIQLLKLWLRRHQFDEGRGCFSGFLITMFVAYLLYTNKLSRSMKSFQIFRFVLKGLSLTKWSEEGASFESVPNMELFHDHFEVVFIDPTGKLNLCSSMSALFYHQVVHQANVTIALIDKQQNDVYRIFMDQALFHLKFDYILKVTNLQEMKGCNEQMDQWCNPIASALSSMNHALSKGLHERTSLIGMKPISYSSWSIEKNPPCWHETSFSLGLLLNHDNANEPLTMGPSADLPEAEAFRDFWGSVAELRRFKDGSICEVVCWEDSNVCEGICKHLLKQHCRIPPSCITASSFHMLLQQGEKSSDDGGDVRIAFQELCNQLTSFTSLPLSITNIHGLSPVLRSTEVLPPRKLEKTFGGSAVKSESCSFMVPIPDQALPPFSQSTELLCFFESSGKWPQEPRAIQRVKAAFNEAISKELQEAGVLAYATPQHVFAFKSGFSFKIKVGYQREVNVLQVHTTETGLHKSRESLESLALDVEMFQLPRVAANLEGVSRRFGAFGDTCRLAKLWISSHLLSNHITDEAADLLCAYLFLHPAPYLAPGSAQSGFLRFLELLSTFPFSSSPLIVDFKSSMSSRDHSTIHSHFKRHRDVLPPMCIFTSVNIKRSLWTEEKPASMVLNRMRNLAKVHFDQLNVVYTSAKPILSQDVETIFKPSLKTYDVLIHLRGSDLPKTCKTTGKVLPVVDFFPAMQFLKQLKSSYGELATFFFDRYHGAVIGVMWRPAAFEAVPFKLISLVCRELNEQGNLVPNIDAIVEDFKVLGRGFVDSVELRTDKWRV